MRITQNAGSVQISTPTEKAPFPKLSLLLSKRRAPQSLVPCLAAFVAGHAGTCSFRSLSHVCSQNWTAREGTTYPSGLRKESRARKIERWCPMLGSLFFAPGYPSAYLSAPTRPRSPGAQQRVGGWGSLVPGLLSQVHPTVKLE